MTIKQMVTSALLLGAIALGGCKEKTRTAEIEKAKAICPVFNAKVKMCKDVFAKTWDAAAGTDHFLDSTCDGQVIGYGIDHPEWMEKLTKCVESTGEDCQAFAKCSVATLHF
jgi:hypothetical protein